MASIKVSGLGASASVFRDGSVHGSYKSFVCVHVVCPKSSVSTEKPHANQKWGRTPLRKRFGGREHSKNTTAHDSPKVPRVGGRATSSSAACSRCRCGRVDGFSRFLDHGVVGRSGVSHDPLSDVVDLATCGIVMRTRCYRIWPKSADVVPRTVQEPLARDSDASEAPCRRFPSGARPRDGSVLWSDNDQAGRAAWSRPRP